MKNSFRDFPDSPVIGNLPSNMGCRFDPWFQKRFHMLQGN